jgi:hypothetical protein
MIGFIQDDSDTNSIHEYPYHANLDHYDSKQIPNIIIGITPAWMIVIQNKIISIFPAWKIPIMFVNISIIPAWMITIPNKTIGFV